MQFRSDPGVNWKKPMVNFGRFVFCSLKTKLLPPCPSSQHSHLDICPNQSRLLCQAWLCSAQWTCRVHSAVLSHLECTAQALLGFLSFLMGSLPHPCSAAGLPKCQGVFWCLEERQCAVSPLLQEKGGWMCGRQTQWGPCWQEQMQQGEQERTEAEMEERGSDPCCPYWPINALLPARRHQMPTSTPHLEMRQVLYCVYIIEENSFFFNAVTGWKQSEWDSLQGLYMGR